MSATKTLAVIGASEETVAHLRLLMKLGARQLQQTWVWGAEAAADFVAVEVHDLGAQGVISRCQSAGVPCAVMAEANEVVVHGLVLRRPFKLDQIVAVLNAAGADSADAGDVEAFADDFYTRNLDEDLAAPSAVEEELWRRRESGSTKARVTGEQAAVGLDEMIHGDPLIEPEKPKPLIQADTTVERGSSEPSKRSEGRADMARHRVVSGGEMPAGVIGVGPVDVKPVAMPPRNESGAPLPASPAKPEAAPEPAGQRLSDYLDGNLIASPTQLQLPDLPALTLDPKKRAYYAEGDLSLLEGYANQAIPRGSAKVAGTAELARVRESQPARTYDELRWLIAMSQASGRLAARLDPGGSYEVQAPVTIDPAFHAHGAIAAALAASKRLHEVAAASKASMEQVFDVVSAYDAIGRLKWTPRQRLAPAPAAEPEKPKPGGGLSRLWPFGKK